MWFGVIGVFVNWFSFVRESGCPTTACDVRSGILHGDLNEQNVLTGPEDDEVRAILDWGDVHGGPRLFDVAVMLTYVLIAPTADRSPWHNVALALAGYLEHSELERRDVALLKVRGTLRVHHAEYSLHILPFLHDDSLAIQKHAFRHVRRRSPSVLSKGYESVAASRAGT